jgi:hypothetical protein
MPLLSRSLLNRRSLLAVMASAALLVMVPAGAAALAAGALAFHRAVAVKPPLNTHVPQETDLSAVACTSARSCLAGGSYERKDGAFEPMVASRSAGIWRRGTVLALPANAAAQPFAEVNGVACVSAARCVAVGDYEIQGVFNKDQPFIATRVRGKWTRAFAPQLPANVGTPIAAQLQGVSCLASGFCEAVGDYVDAAGNAQVMTITKPARGHWQRGVEVAAPANAAPDPEAGMLGIACTGPRACVAVGTYHVGSNELAMGAVEVRGTWRRAVQLRLPPNALGTFARAAAVTCMAPGTCLGVGAYEPTGGGFKPMVFTEAGGTFRRAAQVTAVPRGARANLNASLVAVSCVRLGPCVATGFGRNKAGNSVAMYAVRSSGHWTASFLSLPASAAVGGINQVSMLNAVACVRTGQCTTAGFFVDRSGAPLADAASTG